VQRSADQTPRKGPRPIQDEIATFLRAHQLGPAKRDGRVFSAFLHVAGERLARRAQPVRFARGELVVEVASAAHLHELEAFQGERLRRATNQRLGSDVVRRIAFKPRT
jgi:hypothetical protein